MKQILPFPVPKCFGLHVKPNAYIPVLAAKDGNDKRFDVLKRALLKNFPELEGKMEVVNFADFKKDKLFFFESHFLDYPVLSEQEPLNCFLVAENQAV